MTVRVRKTPTTLKYLDTEAFAVTPPKSSRPKDLSHSKADESARRKKVLGVTPKAPQAFWLAVMGRVQCLGKVLWGKQERSPCVPMQIIHLHV